MATDRLSVGAGREHHAARSKLCRLLVVGRRIRLFDQLARDSRVLGGRDVLRVLGETRPDEHHEIARVAAPSAAAPMPFFMIAPT